MWDGDKEAWPSLYRALTSSVPSPPCGMVTGGLTLKLRMHCLRSKPTVWDGDTYSSGEYAGSGRSFKPTVWDGDSGGMWRQY